MKLDLITFQLFQLDLYYKASIFKVTVEATSRSSILNNLFIIEKYKRNDMDR